MVEAGKPQCLYKLMNPRATPQHPFVAWCCCNYSFCFCTLPAWLCISLTLGVTSMDCHKTQVQGVSLSPASCWKQDCHQHQSRATGSAAVPVTTRKFWHKTHSNIQTSALPAWLCIPLTLRVTSVDCLNWWPLQGPLESLQCWQWSAIPSSEENSVEWRSSATQKVGIASPSLTMLWIFTNCKSNQIPSFEVERKANSML